MSRIFIRGRKKPDDTRDNVVQESICTFSDTMTVIIDSEFKDEGKLKKGDVLLYTPSIGDREILFFDEHDGYGLSAYYRDGLRTTVSVSRVAKVVATIGEPVDGVMFVDCNLFTKEDVLEWYKHVKTHTVAEAFAYMNKKKLDVDEIELPI